MRPCHNECLQVSVAKMERGKILAGINASYCSWSVNHPSCHAPESTYYGGYEGISTRGSGLLDWDEIGGAAQVAKAYHDRIYRFFFQPPKSADLLWVTSWRPTKGSSAGKCRSLGDDAALGKGNRGSEANQSRQNCQRDYPSLFLQQYTSITMLNILHVHRQCVSRLQ